MVEQFPAQLCFHAGRAAASHLFERKVFGGQGYDRHGAVGLCGGGLMRASV